MIGFGIISITSGTPVSRPLLKLDNEKDGITVTSWIQYIILKYWNPKISTFNITIFQTFYDDCDNRISLWSVQTNYMKTHQNNTACNLHMYLYTKTTADTNLHFPSAQSVQSTLSSLSGLAFHPNRYFLLILEVLWRIYRISWSSRDNRWSSELHFTE